MTDTTPGGWPDAARPGYPKDPEQIRYHWVRLSGGGIHSAYWDCYEWNLGRDYLRPCEAAHEWHYLGPCLTPTEVAALVDLAIRSGRLAEREANAMVAISERITDDSPHASLLMKEPHWSQGYNDGCEDVAAAIRARGDA
jgi:hypothetical protein